MNKKDCLLKIRSRKLLSIVETTDNHEITLVIKLGDKVMKQSQFDILLTEINKINNKMDEGFTEVNTKIDVGLKEVNNKVDEVKTEFAAKIDEVNTKIDEVKTELKAEIYEVKTEVKEIKLILKKHDDLFVDHGWLDKSSFE